MIISLYYVDKIPAPRDLRFIALNFTAALVEWAVCGSLNHVYIIQIIDSHSNETVYKITTPTTSVNVTGLKKGVEYIVTVFGRLGNTSGDKAIMLMSLDGTVQLQKNYTNN